MKRNRVTAAVMCVVIVTLLAVLLGSARHSRDDVRQLAQAGAADAYKNFLEYQATQDESFYWYGVAAFRSFEQAYHMLIEGTNKSPNYAFCNEVYGYLVLLPERSQNHISELIAVMDILASDVDDENGHVRMAELRNILHE